MAVSGDRVSLAESGDIPVIHKIFRQSILTLGRRCYDTRQVEAWAYRSNEAQFRRWVEEARTFIYYAGETPVGFGGIEASGHIASLYVAPEVSGKGVAAALLTFLLAHPYGMRPQLTTVASACSRPLFERFGFQVVRLEEVVRNGVRLHRFQMVRKQ